MYFGLYRQGISLMLAFFRPAYGAHDAGRRAAVSAGRHPVVLQLLHVHNLRAMTPEAFGQWRTNISGRTEKSTSSGRPSKKLVGIGLVIVGIYLLWNSVLSWLNWILPDIFGYLFRRLPQVVIGVIIIWLGIKPSPAKKQELDERGDHDDERRRDRLHRHPGVPQRVHRS